MPFLKYLFFLSALFCTANISSQEFPVMAFHGVPEQFTNKASFRFLKESGININFTVYTSNAEAQKALDCAQEAGVKILLFTPELVHSTAATVRRFKNHPALFGYYVRDEPSAAEFGEVSAKIKEIKKTDPLHPTYINLFPNYAENSLLKAKSYDHYLGLYISSVPVDFISFDNYPLMNDVIHKDWYANLESVRNASLRAKKEFWGFANATIFRTYRQPTLAGLRLQIFSNLLYGAQGIQYFTYWTLDDEYWRKNNFGKSMVDPKGLPTPTYHLVKSVNSQVRHYARLFQGSRVTSVFHTDVMRPAQTRKLPYQMRSMKNFRTGGSAIVSYFSNKGSDYVAILNKDLYKDINITFDSTAPISILDSRAVEKRLETGSRVRSTIGAGDILILKF